MATSITPHHLSDLLRRLEEVEHRLDSVRSLVQRLNDIHSRHGDESPPTVEAWHAEQDSSR